MEKANGIKKSPKSAPQDCISSMPDNVITNILNRLPTDEAVRTDILSRKWRLKWTLLTQLVFDGNFFNYTPWPSKRRSCAVKIISRLLFNLKGPVTKFVLLISNYSVLDVEDINQWLTFLSGKAIKELSIENMHEKYLKLPTQLFSCLELKHLELHTCHLHPPTSFHGFPKLLSLDLSHVTFQSYTFITCCPLLEILKIRNIGTASEEMLLEIAKHENLKLLSLSWYLFNNVTMIKRSSIFYLTSLSKLQELELDFGRCKLLAEDDAEKRLPDGAFLCLKNFTLSQVDFNDATMISFVYELLCGSPNLQKLMIEAKDPPSAICSSELGINTMGQLQLRRVLFPACRGLENELCFIKSLLACSPFLQKMDVHPSWSLNCDEKLMFVKSLLKLHRASPIAEIDFY